MKDRIHAFMNDMASNDAKKVSQWFTEESHVWIPPCSPVNGLARITALFRALFGRYHSVQWKVIDILPVAENRCIHICDSTGHLKDADVYTNRVITDIVFNDEGKILSLSDYFKDTSVFTKSRESKPKAHSTADIF